MPSPFDRLLDLFWRTPFLGGKNVNVAAAQRDELRARQLQAVLSLAPIMMAANIINLAIIDFLFWNSGHQVYLSLWTSLLFAVLGVWAVKWRRARGRAERQRASPRGVRLLTLSAAVFGVIWASPLIVMFGDVGEARRIILATCAAGMISGGALALATVWQAALVFALAIELPTAWLLIATGDPMYIGLAALSASFGALIASTVVERGRRFAEQFVTSLNMREQGQVISLLLKEFEESSSDWLWEVDARGKLIRVSQRLASLAGSTIEGLNGRSAIEFLAGEQPRGKIRPDSPVARLGAHFRRKEPFRDLMLNPRINGEHRWWSLSAKPLFDNEGQFLGYRGVGSDVTEAKRAEDSMTRMASYDTLTGLPNRTLLNLRMTNLLERQNRDAGRFAVLSLDLDRFKNVNDTLGHEVGDRLLVEVARRIGAVLRARDIAARFGGDEFVILQANVSQPSDASALARRVIDSLGAPYDIEGHRILVGASVGVAMAPDHGETAEELLRNSDLALYRAKADGKGRHRFFAPSMNTIMQSRRLLEVDLREAIDAGKLEVYFQPLIDIYSGRISACEALVRWDHPVKGFVPPVDFIPLAEETGLVVALGEFVLRKACAEAASWTRDIRVAVNLSSVQFRAGDLVSLVDSVLAETGLAPERLELEITESILIEDRDDALVTLSALRERGVRIALDDFGTGYSSLAYLSSFPFDKIKIDQSFVRDVAVRKDSAAIIRAITSLADTLGMCTTAEGVENMEELNWLRSQGCGEAQGFLFSRPMPASDLKSLLGLAGSAPPELVTPHEIAA